jgi:uncharacterized protein YecT (DUF1311 family)
MSMNRPVIACAIVCAISATSIAVPPASAAEKTAVEKRYTADYDRCQNNGDAANGVTFAMLDCMSAEYKRQDARLNQTYTMLMARLPAARKNALRISERRWLAGRDAGCRRKAKPSEGGTIWGLDMTGCQINETIARTMWLERYR